MERVGEAGIIGDLEAAAHLELIRADGGGKVAVAVDPGGLSDRCGAATPRHPGDVDERVPADRARHGILPERPDHGDRPRSEASEERGLPARLRDAAPADTTQEDAQGQQREGGERAAAGVGRCRRNGDHRGGVATGETRSSEGIATARPGGRDPGRGEDRGAGDEPGPRGPRLERARPAVPRKETCPERPGRERRSPGSHGITPSPGVGASRASPARSPKPHRADRST